MTSISNYIIPLMVLIIIGYGFFKKVDLYDEFVNGAKTSFPMVLTMFPCLLAMILGINIFVKSGILEFFLGFIKPIFNFFKVPFQILPMMIMRPISGSSTLAILNNLFENFGPDSLIGNLASVIQGSTDTTFYVLTLYFGSIGIKKIRYSLWVGLFADLVGIVSAIVITSLFLN